jgi:hypothetical protein
VRERRLCAHVQNRLFLRDKHVYADEYFDFLLRLIRSRRVQGDVAARAVSDGGFEAQLATTQLCTRFVFNTLVHAKEKCVLCCVWSCV